MAMVSLTHCRPSAPASTSVYSIKLSAVAAMAQVIPLVFSVLFWDDCRDGGRVRRAPQSGWMVTQAEAECFHIGLV